MKLDWNNPPGAPTRRIASSAHKILGSFLVGVLSIGVAWAGVGLVPVGQKVPAAGDVAADASTTGMDGSPAEPTDPSLKDFAMPTLTKGQFYGGAAKVSLKPRPEAYKEQFPDAAWNQNEAECEITSGGFARDEHLADLRVRWPETKNCLYMGGYGIGPMNAITKWDDAYGLWSRSVAMSDGSDTVVLTLIDAVYWEAYYDSMCDGVKVGDQVGKCGFLDLADALAKQTGLPAESFVFASTHSHTAMDFIAGWGGVPRWYMQQATDALLTSSKAALAALRPAILESGETIVRARSSERRDHYRSAEDDALSWFRLIDASDQPSEPSCSPTNPSPPPTNEGNGNGFGNAGKEPEPTPTMVCTEGNPGSAIATVGAYAAHPVTEDESGGEADADFPAVFAKSVEDAYGGVGMFLQTGLGNISPRGDKIEMGTGLAAAVPALGSGTPEEAPNVRAGRTFWAQPVTNVPLGHLGAAGIFDRTFNKSPAAVHDGKSQYPNKKCSSASHVSVRTSVSAAWVGSMLITGAPGEVFSNLTNTIEEKNPNGVTLALGLVNDGLGYIIQSFETDHVGRQAAGFVGGPTSEYEDAYSIDHCFGDVTLEHTLRLLEETRKKP